LRRAGLVFREIKQTRHTCATILLGGGVSPLWIAKVMGHRNTEMVIKVYSKYVEGIRGTNDGAILDNTCNCTQGNHEEV
jgi:integrase